MEIIFRKAKIRYDYDTTLLRRLTMTGHTHSIWVISTDSNHCRIYSYQRAAHALTLVKEIEHPELRLKKSESLTTDRPGHYQGNDSARGAYSPHTDPKEVKVIEFAREIAEFANEGRNKHLYDQLIIVSPPHMDGLLLKQLDENVAKLITHTIKKDVVHGTDQELIALIQGVL